MLVGLFLGGGMDSAQHARYGASRAPWPQSRGDCQPDLGEVRLSHGARVKARKQKLLTCSSASLHEKRRHLARLFALPDSGKLINDATPVSSSLSLFFCSAQDAVVALHAFCRTSESKSGTLARTRERAPD